jgi:FkbM family methyltransferase
MLVEVDNYKIYCEDPRFIEEVYNLKEYSFADNDKTDNVVIDLGSNIGTYSMYIYPRAKVIYAIEPSPEFDLLERNVEENKLDRIKAFKMAISGDNGTAMMCKNAGTGSWKLGNADNMPTTKVVTRTLFTFMDEHGINHVDMLKIDAEGAEIEIFSSPDFVKVRDRIDLIFGEYHGNSEKLKGILELNNFEVSFIYDKPHFIARRVNG